MLSSSTSFTVRRHQGPYVDEATTWDDIHIVTQVANPSYSVVGYHRAGSDEFFDCIMQDARRLWKPLGAPPAPRPSNCSRRTFKGPERRSRLCKEKMHKDTYPYWRGQKQDQNRESFLSTLFT